MTDVTPYVHAAFNAWGQRNYSYPTTLPADVNVFGYNARWGYKTDSETGLVYCQNRYYDPANGRWLTRDPISYSGGINLYGYCGSVPVGRSDPLGLSYEDSHFTRRDQQENAWRPPGMVVPGDWSRNQTKEETSEALERLRDAAFNFPKNLRPYSDCLGEYTTSKYEWFLDQVETGGPWDFKKDDPGYQDFGNWHYGYASREAGIPDAIADRAAGANQWWKRRKNPRLPSEGNPLGGSPYGDDPNDMDLIDAGQKAWDDEKKP
jgi:RHS repeat-associated protein